MWKLWSDVPSHCKRNYRKMLIIFLIAAISALTGFCYRALENRLPDRITIVRDKEENFDFGLPMEAELQLSQAGSFLYNNELLTEDELRISLKDSFSVCPDKTGSYSVIFRLFGKFTVKSSVLDVIESTQIIPLGVPIGIVARTNGVLVLGSGNFTDARGQNYEPKDAVKTGDYIIEVNHQVINSKEELVEQIQQNSDSSVVLTIRREKEYITITLPIVETASKERKIGIWVRDDTQGIGTLTYITSDGKFGALGHGITDVDTGVLLEFGKGEIYTAEINSITKGKAGEPGELSGVIHQGENVKLGSLSSNTEQGIYGTLTADLERIKNAFALKKLIPYEVGFSNQIETGSATILCSVEGKPMEYQIEIEKIKQNVETVSKGLVIRITDERLLSLTGGIVQGMSGSPILQNGKIIGAVTHVLVNDPTRGYGIFVDDMLEQGEKE